VFTEVASMQCTLCFLFKIIKSFLSIIVERVWFNWFFPIKYVKKVHIVIFLTSVLF